MRTLSILLAGLALALGAGRAAAQSPAFVVVVSESSPAQSITKEQLSRLFLKKVTALDGVTVVPVDQTDASPARRAFSREVHGREVASIKSYWQQQIFSGRAVPPVERGTDEDVLAFVRANRAAIGYVSAGAPLPPGVRVLAIRGS